MLKYLAHEELLAAVNQVMDQGSYLSPGLEGTESGQTTTDFFARGKNYSQKMEVIMPYSKKVKDLMIPLEDYPHIPYWFTLRQAMAIVREAAIKFEGSFEPRAVLVFDEKYQLMGMLTLRDVVRAVGAQVCPGQRLIKADRQPGSAPGRYVRFEHEGSLPEAGERSDESHQSDGQR